MDEGGKVNAKVFPAVLAVPHTKVRVRATLLSPPASLFSAASKVSGEEKKSRNSNENAPHTPIFRFVVRNTNKTTRGAPDREGLLLRGEEVVVRFAGAGEGEEFTGVEVGEDLRRRRRVSVG
jgi:hypothetical protein